MSTGEFWRAENLLEVSLVGFVLVLMHSVSTRANLEERAAQVAIMQLIYTQAYRVIIWLGADDDLTSTAIGALVRLCELFDRTAPPSQQIPSRSQVPESQRLTAIEGVALARFF